MEVCNFNRSTGGLDQINECASTVTNLNQELTTTALQQMQDEELTATESTVMNIKEKIILKILVFRDTEVRYSRKFKFFLVPNAISLT